MEAGRPAQDVRSGTIAGIIDGMPGSEASPVFVGRDAELEFLERALDVAVGGATGTVLVGAESGVGKSRLISQFAAKARDRALVLAGGCVEVGTALPYAPVTALLRMLVRSRGAGEVAALLSDRSHIAQGFKSSSFFCGMGFVSNSTPGAGSQLPTLPAKGSETLLGANG